MQSVGADDQVEPPSRAMLERDVTVVGDGRDLIAEHVLDFVSGRVVVDLAEIVAHDLDVPVGHRADQLEVVDTRRLGCPWPVHIEDRGARGMFLDARQHTHPFRYLHRGTEQVDGVAAGLAQHGRAFDHRDVIAMSGQPVGQHRSRDARPGNQDLHAGQLTYR